MAGFSEDTKSLLAQRAETRARIAQIPFDGSIEVKENSSGKYIYARARVAGKNTSVYLGPYSEEVHALYVKQASELRVLKKNLRRIERELAKLGHIDGELSPSVLLNIDFARANMKTLIYGQAVLEGVSTTFPQTEDILENGIVSGVKASDVQKILNLKHAWEFVLDKDVVACQSDFAVLSRVAALVNEGFYEYGGQVRRVPVRIGGCSWIPPIPTEEGIKELLIDVQNLSDPTDAAVRIALRLMRAQAFIDGNKRTAVIFANHLLVSCGAGLLMIPEEEVSQFRKNLVAYYETNDEDGMAKYVAEKCLMRL